MERSDILFIILGGILLLVLCGFILYRYSYNSYLNKRLNGEVEERKFFNYKAFAILMTFCICAFFIGFLGSGLIQARTELDHYRGRLEELYPREQMMLDDAVIADFSWLTEGMQNQDLSGYIVTVTTNGDFKCYTAIAKDTIINNSLLPSLIIYFKYIGDDLIHPSIEFQYTYLYGQSGSTVTYNKQYLYISRTYHDEKLISIDITLSVDPQGNKNPQIHSQSHFDFDN